MADVVNADVAIQEIQDSMARMEREHRQILRDDPVDEMKASHIFLYAEDTYSSGVKLMETDRVATADRRQKTARIDRQNEVVLLRSNTDSFSSILDEYLADLKETYVVHDTEWYSKKKDPNWYKYEMFPIKNLPKPHELELFPENWDLSGVWPLDEIHPSVKVKAVESHRMDSYALRRTEIVSPKNKDIITFFERVTWPIFLRQDVSVTLQNMVLSIHVETPIKKFVLTRDDYSLLHETNNVDADLTYYLIAVYAGSSKPGVRKTVRCFIDMILQNSLVTDYYKLCKYWRKARALPIKEEVTREPSKDQKRAFITTVLGFSFEQNPNDEFPMLEQRKTYFTLMCLVLMYSILPHIPNPVISPGVGDLSFSVESGGRKVPTSGDPSSGGRSVQRFGAVSASRYGPTATHQQFLPSSGEASLQSLKLTKGVTSGSTVGSLAVTTSLPVNRLICLPDIALYTNTETPYNKRALVVKRSEFNYRLDAQIQRYLTSMDHTKILDIRLIAISAHLKWTDDDVSKFERILMIYDIEHARLEWYRTTMAGLSGTSPLLGTLKKTVVKAFQSYFWTPRVPSEADVWVDLEKWYRPYTGAAQYLHAMLWIRSYNSYEKTANFVTMAKNYDAGQASELLSIANDQTYTDFVQELYDITYSATWKSVYELFGYVDFIGMTEHNIELLTNKLLDRKSDGIPRLSSTSARLLYRASIHLPILD